MKNTYTTPEMEVISFENEDIITTSDAIVPEIDPEEGGLPVIPLD